MTPPPQPAPRKKLIEVALPLEAINRESAREKSIRHGHPSTLHLWWARRPLAACRAVLFASLVDDPSSDPMFANPDGSPDHEAQAARRTHLFNLIEELVKWQNSNDPTVIGAARAEIARAVASRKMELGELKKDAKLEGGMTPWDLVVRGTVQTSSTVRDDKVNILIDAPRLPAKAVNAFLAEHAPPVLDPFCGGGSIPLEAQRLGLRAFASDLNPVPVLITKALIEIPPKFAGQPPVNPESRGEASSAGSSKPSGRKKQTQGQLGIGGWKGAAGLAEDVRYYGKWMRDEAEKRIGHLYPKIKVTEAMARDRKDLRDYVGQELTVIAWLWARTVPSPNPAASGAPVPLVRSFWLSTKKGKEAWVEPVVMPDGRSYKFEVRTDRPGKNFDPGTGTIGRKGGRCILTGAPMAFPHVRTEARAGHMGVRLMAIVAEGTRGRVYISPDEEHVKTAESAKPTWRPEGEMPKKHRNFQPPVYGMNSFGDLFTNRQLVALTTFSDLVMEARAKVLADGGSQEYADAVATYLAFAQSKACNRSTSLCIWETRMDRLVATFGRQAVPMVWDFAETNLFAGAGGDLYGTVTSVCEVLDKLTLPTAEGTVRHQSAVSPYTQAPHLMVATDPPYYDNINYADLSDFFYIWLRRSLAGLYPSLFRTLQTPKEEELIATPHRHEGSKQKATEFFETGLGRAFDRMREAEHRDYPLTVYYAFKQAESEDEADDADLDSSDTTTASTGWETMLEGLIKAGFCITGTWPVRTEQPKGLRAYDQNALASSIVLVCHPRGDAAPMASRREFITALKRELPDALRNLQSGNIAPVDLAQAAIGPGMAVFTRYARVLESDGSRLTVRMALALINQVLDEVLAEQEGEYDADTRWAINKWFEQHAHDEAPYGEADVLARAMAIGVNGLVSTGIITARAGKVRLLPRAELMGGRPDEWDPATDPDICHWEVCQYLCRSLESGGEAAAADLLRRIEAAYAGASEIARDLAYRLYSLCERKRWAQEAIGYNALVVAWPEIQKLARRGAAPAAAASGLFG